ATPIVPGHRAVPREGVGSMEPLYAILGGLGGLLLGFLIVRLWDRSQLKSVRAQAEDILRAGRESADTLLKEAELKATDDLFQQREALNREMEQVRGELREQERRLDKREDSLEEKHQGLQKKERSLDHLKSKLSERKAEVERRSQEAEALIKQQAQKLH